MKILFIQNATLGNPGAAASEYFPATLSRYGHSVRVVGLSGGDPSFLNAAGVKTIEAARGLPWLTTLLNTVRVKKPDIVHVFIHRGCGIYPLVLKYSTGRPRFFLDIRSPLLHTGLSRCIVRLKNQLEAMPYDSVFAHSIESAWTVIGSKIDTNWLPCGVDLESTSVSEKDKPDRATTRLIYVGSLHPRRRIPKMVDAVLLAAQSCPVCLDIYGDGQDKQVILDRVSQEDDRSSRVRLKGTISRQELFNRMKNYDLGLSYVPGAIYDSAPPLKTVEYLANGLPVLATNTKGNAIFIEDNKNGLLVGEEPDEFARGIILLAQDDEKRLRLADNARPSVAEYDWRQIVRRKLLPVYIRVLRGHN